MSIMAAEISSSVTPSVYIGLGGYSLSPAYKNRRLRHMLKAPVMTPTRAPAPKLLPAVV